MFSLLLYALHILRTLSHLLTRPRPRPLAPLNAQRKRVPRHLALVLKDADEHDREAVVESLVEAERCCRESGVRELSVYDRRGVLKSQHTTIRRLLADETAPAWSPTPSPLHLPIELPPTPPSSSKPSPPSSVDGLSDAEGVLTFNTSPTSPKAKRSLLRNRLEAFSTGAAASPSLKINVLSYFDSKPAIARAALSLALRPVPPLPTKPSISEIDNILQSEWTFPDVVLVHSMKRLPWWAIVPQPFELDGFPPWHIHLSEIYHDPPRRQLWPWSNDRGEAVRQHEFELALDGYENAEMRLGK